jgi:hypothetical protein
MFPNNFRFIWLSGFREEELKKKTIRNKNCLWRPCLLTDRDEMCSPYSEHYIVASYQVSVHLAKRCQR